MKIGIDASYSLDTSPSGVGVYSTGIIKALAESFPDDRFRLCYRSNRFFRAMTRRRAARNTSRHLLEPFFLPGLQRRVQLFHGLNQRLPPCTFNAAVATFHDLFVMTADYSTPEFRRRFARIAQDTAEHSDHIIAVSQYTAALVAEILSYPSDRITVVHHGVERIPLIKGEEIRQFRKEHDLEAPFILHVGAIQKRKNIEGLLAAFERIQAPTRLVLAGAEGYGGGAILERLEASSAAPRIRRFGYVDRPLLERLYRSASVLAFPSLEEGFGLPVLEAMSAGLPVVTSNRSALADVAGDAGLLVNPEDPYDLRIAIEEALDDGPTRRHLIEAGFKREGEFSWIKAAHETMRVYRRLAK